MKINAMKASDLSTSGGLTQNSGFNLNKGGKRDETSSKTIRGRFAH
jgi:hypothetical protein